MKKSLLPAILAVLLTVSACQSNPPAAEQPPVASGQAPSAASAAETIFSSAPREAAAPAQTPPAQPETPVAADAAVTAEPITVEDLLLRDYVRIYEAYCGGVEFQKTAGLSADTLGRYLLGWLSENDALEPYAVYSGSNIDYYSVSPQDAAAFYGLFWDDGTWAEKRSAPSLSDGLRYSAEDIANAKPAATPEVRIKRYERQPDGGYRLTVQRFMNGREWYPAEYEFAPVTVGDALPPMLAGKTAPGGTVYRFASMHNLPLSAPENTGSMIDVRTKGDLLALAALVNTGDASYRDNVYRLTADLDLEGAAFAPIGSYTSGDLRDPAPGGFSTTFDGQGHKISNLTVTEHNGSAGLFARVGTNGFVTNVTLENCAISSADPADGVSYPVGGIAGELVGGMISRCTVSGKLAGTRDVGGIVGRADGGATVQECRSDTQLSGNRQVGGIVGSAVTGRLIECTATGRIDGEALGHTAPDRIGGFAGLIENATIDRGIVSVRIRANTARTTVGSFAGVSTGTLVGCFYNTDLSRNREPVGSAETGAPKTIFPRELIGMTQKELEDTNAFG